MIDYDNKKHKLFNDFLLISQISPRTADKWIRNGTIKTFETNKGKALNLKDYEELLRSDEIKDAYIEAIGYDTQLFNYDQQPEQKNKLQKEIDFELEKGKGYIDKLKEFHFLNRDKFDILRDESAECAAYLIFVKVLNVLYEIWEQLSNKSLMSDMLYRPFNEALWLAEYFLITSDAPEGKIDLRKWYREDITPRAKKLRKVIEEYNLKNLPLDVPAELLEKMKGANTVLYGLQSGSIHTSYFDLKRFIIFGIKNDVPIHEGFQYMNTTNLRKTLESCLYLHSLILTAYLGFLSCFSVLSNILSEKDIDSLDKLRNELFADRKRIQLKFMVISQSKESRFEVIR